MIYTLLSESVDTPNACSVDVVAVPNCCVHFKVPSLPYFVKKASSLVPALVPSKLPVVIPVIYTLLSEPVDTPNAYSVDVVAVPNCCVHSLVPSLLSYFVKKASQLVLPPAVPSNSPLVYPVIYTLLSESVDTPRATSDDVVAVPNCFVHLKVPSLPYFVTKASVPPPDV